MVWGWGGIYYRIRIWKTANVNKNHEGIIIGNKTRGNGSHDGISIVNKARWN